MNKDRYERSLARFKSTPRAEVLKWTSALQSLAGSNAQLETEHAMAMLAWELAVVEQLYDGVKYSPQRAQKYLLRLSQVQPNAIDLWVARLSAFRSSNETTSRIDSAFGIIVADAFFPQERFDSECFNRVLGEATKPKVPTAPPAQGLEPRHFRSVLNLKLDKEYTPGRVFRIVPKEDAAIIGDCHWGFDCRREIGGRALKYQLVTVIVAKLPSGEEVIKRSYPYLQENGKFTSLQTWPAGQEQKGLEFPVAFGGSGSEPRITGKGSIYFYLVDAQDNVLSNIVCVEGSLSLPKPSSGR